MKEAGVLRHSMVGFPLFGSPAFQHAVCAAHLAASERATGDPTEVVGAYRAGTTVAGSAGIMVVRVWRHQPAKEVLV